MTIRLIRTLALVAVGLGVLASAASAGPLDMAIGAGVAAALQGPSLQPGAGLSALQPLSPAVSLVSAPAAPASR